MCSALCAVQSCDWIYLYLPLCCSLKQEARKQNASLYSID